MTPDLKLLVWVVALTFIEVVAAALAANAQVGLPLLAGNRDGMQTLTGLAGRAQRAHRNMLESLPLFIALVLVAHIAGKVNDFEFDEALGLLEAWAHAHSRLIRIDCAGESRRR